MKDKLSCVGILVILAFWATLCSCEVNLHLQVDSKPLPTDNENNSVVTDAYGSKFRLLKDEKSLSSKMDDIELWEKVDPPDHKHYYSKVVVMRKNANTNIPPAFLPVDK